MLVNELVDPAKFADALLLLVSSLCTFMLITPASGEGNFLTSRLSVPRDYCFWDTIFVSCLEALGDVNGFASL